MRENFPELKREMILQHKDSPKQDTLKRKKNNSPGKHILMKLENTKHLKSSQNERQITYNKATLH